ncbi:MULTISPECIES: hypothetical protein [Xenorhabdus]|uniref:hypothetical protein n=1 Tax=Xenorhabdus TaxID=626 RepID=UPI0006917D06|nr:MULTISPECIES: hypothetical protein [Xenorhabdus]
MIKITLLTFSGRENYQWFFDGTDIKPLLDFMRDKKKGINFGISERRLGFSGFFVEIEDSAQGSALQYGLINSFHICDGMAENLQDSKELGLVLLEKFTQDDPLKKHVKQEIQNLQSDNIDTSLNAEQQDEEQEEQEYKETEFNQIHEPSWHMSVKFTNPLTGRVYDVDAARYNQGFWNDPTRIALNNCYAYACNYASNDYPQPGSYGGKPITFPYTKRYLQAVIDGAIADGLVKLDEFTDAQYHPNYVIALYTMPDNSYNWDYHWYRLVFDQYRTQMWAHKLGKERVRKTDNQKKIIRDPNKADRGKYTVFGGYFIVNNQVKIKA